ncbi:MAG: hypothetical protein QXG39_01930 [Candidatus Aenigmatarchaeota archaeon]
MLDKIALKKIILYLKLIWFSSLAVLAAEGEYKSKNYTRLKYLLFPLEKPYIEKIEKEYFFWEKFFGERFKKP